MSRPSASFEPFARASIFEGYGVDVVLRFVGFGPPATRRTRLHVRLFVPTCGYGEALGRDFSPVLSIFGPIWGLFRSVAAMSLRLPDGRLSLAFGKNRTS